MTFKSARTYVSITKFNPSHQDFYPLIWTNKPQNIRGSSVTDKLPTSKQVHFHFRTNCQLQYQLKTEFYNNSELQYQQSNLVTLHFSSHAYNFNITSLQSLTDNWMPLHFNSPTQWHTAVNRHHHSSMFFIGKNRHKARQWLVIHQQSTGSISISAPQ